VGSILRIARHEVRCALRGGGAVLLLLGPIALLAAAVAVRWPGYVQAREDKVAASETLRSLWLDQGEKGPHSAGHLGTVAVRPQPPLSLLVPGIEAYTGQWVRLVTHAQHEPARRPAEDRGPGRRFGEMSAFLVLAYLTPLVVFAFGSEVVARESGGGTLALLLAQGVTPARLLAGKILGVAALFVPQFCFPFALAVVLPALAPEFAGAGQQRLGLIGLAFGAYLASLVLLGIGVSGFARSGGTALVALLALWFGSALVAPRVAASVAEAVDRAPSSFAFRRAYDQGLGDAYVMGYGGARSFTRVFEKVQADLMREHGVSRPQDLPVNAFGHALEETEEMGQRSYDASFGSLADAFERQARWQRVAAWLSPATALRNLAEAVAETDHAAHLRFVRDAEGYRRRMMRTLNMEVAAKPDPSYDIRSRRGAQHVSGRELWERVPAFAATHPPTRQLLASHVQEACALVLWLAGSLAFAAVGLRSACARVR
jgi:ABC-2 type transport system permease protein